MSTFHGGGSVPWWPAGPPHGSQGVLYQRTQEAEAEGGFVRTVYLNSISCLPECSLQSHEELRWEDLKMGNGSTAASTPSTSTAPNAAQPVWPAPTSAAPTAPAGTSTQSASPGGGSNPACVTVEIPGDSGALITVRPDGSVRIEMGTGPGSVRKAVHEIGAGGQVTVRVLPASQGQSSRQDLGSFGWQGQGQQKHATTASPPIQGEIKAPPGWFSQSRPSAFGGPSGAQQAPFGRSTAPAAALFGGGSAPLFGSQTAAPFGSGGHSTAATPFGSSATGLAFSNAAASPFGGSTAASLFGGGTAASPFGPSIATAASPFGGSSTAASLFGDGTAASPFGPSTATAASPFGGSSTGASPFGSSLGAASGAPGAASGPAAPHAVPHFGFSLGTGFSGLGSSFLAPAFGAPASSASSSDAKLGTAGKGAAGAGTGAAPSNAEPFGAAPSNTGPFGAGPSSTGPSGAASPPAAASPASGFGFGAQSAWAPGSLKFGCFAPSSSAGLGGWAQGGSTSPTTHLDPAGAPGSGPEGGPGGSFPSSASPTGALRGLGEKGRSGPDTQLGPAKASPVKEEPAAEGRRVPAQPTPSTPSPSPSSSPAPFAIPVLSFSLGTGFCFGGTPFQFGSSPQPNAQPGAGKQASVNIHDFEFVAGSAMETAAACPSTSAQATAAGQPPPQQQAQQGSPADAASHPAASDGAASPAGAMPGPPGASSAFPFGSPFGIQRPGGLGAPALHPEQSMGAPASEVQPTPASPAETQILKADEVEGQAPAAAKPAQDTGAEVQQAQHAGAGGLPAGEQAGTAQDEGQQATEAGAQGHLDSPAEVEVAAEAGASKEGEWEEVPRGGEGN